jgi:biotin carboxylase
MVRVLVLGAGGPAGVNTCRALNAAGHEVFARDANPAHLVWCKPYADTTWEVADLVIPQPDSLVLELAQRGSEPPSFLPSLATVLVCQDKFQAGIVWRRAGLRTDPSVLVDSIPCLDAAQELGYPHWLRARHGAGAKGAILARSWKEERHWFGFWRERDPSIDLVAEAFLPGRDLSWASVWHKGEVKAAFARERLEYLYPHLTPEGLTGTPTRARIVCEPAVDEMAAAAVRAIDEEPHGIFSVDLREDADGVPRPTEINAGRFSTTVGLWSLQPGSNLVNAAVELALTGSCEFEPLPEGLTLSRHIDCGHQFTYERSAVAA